jgi:glutamate carboxypeptidase
MRRLASTDPRIGLEVTGGINRPPMERSAAVLRLYEMARDVARELAHELPEGATGGASDGNFTAALGIPTLDGLGAIGDGAHARHEHVRIDALPLRSAILAGLIARLTTRGPSSADRPGTPSRA